jgi:hypothetical protein
MTFYANSVIEWRESVSTCELLGRTVVLADGLTGADALAAGWWTAFWQVPVLLHNGTSELPQVTKESLQTLNIKNLVILGGEKKSFLCNSRFKCFVNWSQNLESCWRKSL